ncbi:SusC/RagA family TonB-linked outer membrane protein [Tunicatimonas pelagia]|uniref:SusC/RagA family TonB-linked outer membrane protein n=1 Tax=Tunicatimonas pelagia TaxID=931531 RepID=UPI0026663DC4|nr:TonB-dependent receptor [Tunicatimonas pelagia]WKN42408.1 TonB-dependent receptor [Tunicatimonas pelagia]
MTNILPYLMRALGVWLLCLWGPASLLAQSQISGTVTDGDTNETLPGVNILVKGSAQGTITDVNGNYRLNAPAGAEVLIFSSIGYTSVEVEINGRSTVNLVMAPDIQSLQEVVVVGFGTEEKVNLTGAVGTADGEVLENRPIANVGEGLQGVIPNLNIAPQSGDPSQPIRFNVRGYTSINGGEPLVLVDNIPMDLNRINPNNIEKISVLKDASASAIYGARAAYGVILVTTKSGRDGKVHVNLNTQWSLAQPIFNMNPITDPHQFVLARNIANQRTFGQPSFDQDFVDGTRRYSENPIPENEWGVVDGELRFYGNNNYQENIMTDFAPTDQHDISIVGGNEGASFYASIGYLNKDGYLRNSEKNENFKRYNVLLKADFQVNDWLKLEERIMFNSQRNDEPHFYNWDVNINSLARVSPIRPIQFPDLPFYQTEGDRAQYEPYIGMYFGGTNFFPYLEDGGRTTFTNNDTWLTQGVEITPIEGLKLYGSFSYNLFDVDYQDVQSKVEIVSTDLNEENPISNGFSGDDWIQNRTYDRRYYVFNTFAEYEMKQFPRHDLTALIGFNQEYRQEKSIGVQNRSLITPAITDINATVGTQQTFGASSDNALRGAFYRVKYIYDNRYLFESSGRYDGTSRFPTDDRFGFFPSVSVGWRISEEAFMDGTDSWLDNLKVRVSYGELGNQVLQNQNQLSFQAYAPEREQINYPYIPTLGIGQSPYMMSNGFIPFVSAPGLVSSTLTWETVATRNLGLDLTMFGNRFDASFDVYTRETRNMLLRVEAPDVLGTAPPRTNGADLITRGWEAAITWQDRIGSNWGYNIQIAISDFMGEITRYNNPNGALNIGGDGELDNYYEGQQLGEIWGYETVGIFQTQEEVDNAPTQEQLGANWRAGDIRYADLDGDGEITPGSNTLEDPGDRRVIGNTTPRGSFGFTGGVSYKNFRLTAFFQGIMQRDIWPSSGNWTWFFPFNAGHVEEYFLTDTWSEENPDAYFPAAHISTGDGKNKRVQSRFIQNAAYVRLKNITLSYNLPEELTSRAGMSSARIFFTGANLWEYSPIRAPLDPETAYGAIQYPIQRIFTLGVGVSF